MQGKFPSTKFLGQAGARVHADFAGGTPGIGCAIHFWPSPFPVPRNTYKSVNIRKQDEQVGCPDQVGGRADPAIPLSMEN